MKYYLRALWVQAGESDQRSAAEFQTNPNKKQIGIAIVIIGIMCLEFKLLANPIPFFETVQTFDNRYKRIIFIPA
jgi:hypothetical protein